ncbi:2-succinyl-6-hydroxy-2,4-cyclohexadiene-1-carboxylate synthase [Pasteurella skyensis]|uniref:Putative 2-succinyl-6-hydroxy-2,4-cyclohexadiene-1-carboxylate synthase n=1 Tax=Phocoenobacter skyensis TaxID=97481 RepID=A0AAJ6NC12_9PAST|nr:2-succinyl-6-hydroxy-2,4-cyclohexadiene-1-carboxylate synthase [Pasteurella skyensis]MDP8162617.1 2-succinyl-6-hydroxy-2,4-cyclohexadiene-1-carboxylate synthase [Pasteurella skyensis]MDP8169837.1 2-succinyl-6-hydroxy-2,4-cyclohexadiene-1-carboxylate synthase [Pasteurella skyensis]MDP8172785.1 2-succinyl-6-hydroxy-2,4-cyclohexadiene-1-carboxylate synthase [Pasteurella skyensis]MDP8174011.1 2-succinyl-6-hydroxy-2,4-cyclohexadiene-1-carboxylate synthase [Pasteurella skyensis]MDP8179298.1 2-suc
MLAFQWHHSHKSNAQIPVVFLHGLLGSQQDWGEVLKNLQNVPQIVPLTIDLPYHEKSEDVSCDNFEDVCQQLHHTLQQLTQPFWLVGYSLGGRIALHYNLFINNPFLIGTIVEGANIGLPTEQQRQQRWQNDLHWIQRFENENIENVLQDWYQQAVFSDLHFAKKNELITKRKHNKSDKIAKMLQATSLAKQSFLLNKIKNLSNIYFLVGERDQKFVQQAKQYRLNYQIIKNAGHNAHWENSLAFTEKLIAIMTK